MHIITTNKYGANFDDLKDRQKFINKFIKMFLKCLKAKKNYVKML